MVIPFLTVRPAAHVSFNDTNEGLDRFADAVTHLSG